MRWYMVIDEAGANGPTGADAKTALLTAQRTGGLQPRLLYHGARNDFTAWMQQHGAEVIDAAPSFLAQMRAAESAGTYRAHSVGHWLRLAILQIEQSEEFILYTDCDVIFLKPVNWAAIRPKYFSAAPEFKPGNWNYFNAGIMVMNIPAMQASYRQFEALIISRMAETAHYQYDDQLALNEAYRGHWERLDPHLNWKPYWGFKAQAQILHFHGPKLDVLEAIAAGRWTDSNPTARQLRNMTAAHLQAYIDWLSVLGDRMQTFDPQLAFRLQNIASALLRTRAHAPSREIDVNFMDFNMFM